MIVEIDNKLVSQDVFDKHFVCDLSACKGACCIEGDDGAPLDSNEIQDIEKHIEDIKPFMTDEGIDSVNKNGVFYLDRFEKPVTTLVENKACAFVTLDKNGITKCGIEQAYRENKIPINKPISCHLYPIRIKTFPTFESLTYDRWPICKDACVLGENLKVPVFKFLKEPLIRKYGQSFFDELSLVYKELNQLNKKD